MRGLWLENQQLKFRKDLPLPELEKGDVLIQPRLSGICSTDLELVNGYYPFTGIPGHEFVGEVIKAPGFPDFEGKRVVGEINITCGYCIHCQQGRGTHCANGTVPEIPREYIVAQIELKVIDISDSPKFGQ